ncbi:hypothetical protein N2152v2_010182 [Parachlorella kessleri]
MARWLGFAFGLAVIALTGFQVVGAGAANATACSALAAMPDAVSLCVNDWYKFGVDWNKTGFYSSPGQCARSELVNATSPATGAANPGNATVQAIVATDFLRSLHVPILTTATFPVAPWYFCLSDDCKAQLSAADACGQWDVVYDSRLP